jgi:hypothetical protein
MTIPRNRAECHDHRAMSMNAALRVMGVTAMVKLASMTP